MDDFAFSQEFEYVAYVLVVDEPEQIVVGYACFLFCCCPVNATKRRGRSYGIRSAIVFPPELCHRPFYAIQQWI